MGGSDVHFGRFVRPFEWGRNEVCEPVFSSFLAKTRAWRCPATKLVKNAPFVVLDVLGESVAWWTRRISAPRMRVVRSTRLWEAGRELRSADPSPLRLSAGPTHPPAQRWTASLAHVGRWVARASMWQHDAVGRCGLARRTMRGAAPRHALATRWLEVRPRRCAPSSSTRRRSRPHRDRDRSRRP